MDLKTVSQGEPYDQKRDVVCQLPPEAGYGAHVGTIIKKAASGMNDAPRRWWNILGRTLRNYGMVPTRADRCCDVLYSGAPISKSSQVQPETKRPVLKNNSACDDAVEYIIDPNTGSAAHGNKKMSKA